MNKILYLKLNEISVVHDKQVHLKDVAQLYCEDKNLLSRCSALKIKTIHQDKEWRYVENILLIIEKLHQLEPSIQIVSRA